MGCHFYLSVELNTFVVICFFAFSQQICVKLYEYMLFIWLTFNK